MRVTRGVDFQFVWGYRMVGYLSFFLVELLLHHLRLSSGFRLWLQLLC